MRAECCIMAGGCCTLPKQKASWMLPAGCCSNATNPSPACLRPSCMPASQCTLACSKRKLLEKQKEGKKRMRKLGSVEVPQEVFHELMKAGNK